MGRALLCLPYAVLRGLKIYSGYISLHFYGLSQLKDILVSILAKNINHPAEKSVRFPLKTHEKFVGLSQKLGRTQAELVIQMVDYFHRTKKDPIDLNDELLKNSILKNGQVQISFMKTQEKIFLIP